MELTDKQKEKLKEHSKLHKGGMRSKHMRNMKKFMMEGMSFTKAHNKAKKLDEANNKDEPPKMKSKGLTPKQKKNLPENLKKAIMKKKSSSY